MERSELPWAQVQTSNSLNANDSNLITFRPRGTDNRVPLVNISTDLSSGTTTDSSVKQGLDLGLGAEYMVVDNVSVGAEYNYVNYGHVTTSPAELTGSTTVTTFVRNNQVTRTFPINETNVFTQGSTDSVHVSTLMGTLSFYFSNYVGL